MYDGMDCEEKYSFKCLSCNKEYEVRRPYIHCSLAEFNKNPERYLHPEPTLECCGKTLKWKKYSLYPVGRERTNNTGDAPAGFYSRALGVHPSQIQDEMKRHPDWKFDPKGRLWCNGYRDQCKKAKELGYQVG